MKATLSRANGIEPGQVVLEAENANEVMLLRAFVRGPGSDQECKMEIGLLGFTLTSIDGNDSRYSVQLGWRPAAREQQFDLSLPRNGGVAVNLHLAPEHTVKVVRHGDKSIVEIGDRRKAARPKWGLFW
jgi:hypothetical protein